MPDKAYWEKLDYTDPTGLQIPPMPKMYVDYFNTNAADLPPEKREEIWQQWYINMTPEEKKAIEKLAMEGLPQEQPMEAPQNSYQSMDSIAASLKSGRLK